MEQAQASPTLQGLRVLVVEDELLVAMLVEEQLAEEGCTVIGPAANTTEALALIKDARLDAAVLDLNLNGERPTNVAEALTARQVPFVIVTGYSDRQLEEPVLQRAPRLGKPFRAEELVRILARITRTAA
jgi:CheY-like chemotaxis protein